MMPGQGPHLQPQVSWKLHPSPLDRIRGGRRERALELGLSASRRQPFEANQSFPGVRRGSHVRGDDSPDMGDLRKYTLGKLKGTDLNSFSFSPGCSKGSFACVPDRHARSLSGSWVFYNFVGGGAAFPTSVQNPNKAVVTIDARTTEILIANKMACQLLGLCNNQLTGRRLCDFFATKKARYALTETHLESSGELVVVSGKVMDVVNAEGATMPVSVWAKRLQSEEEPRCLVVLEPVERTTALVTFDRQGVVRDCDENMAMLFGYVSASDLRGTNVRSLVPSLVLPREDGSLAKEVRKQRATGRTRDGASFPLSILLRRRCLSCDALIDGEEEAAPCHTGGDSVFYEGVVWVFANISGMIAVLPDGTIHSCNTNFSLMLFGYTQDQLVGKDITLLIPGFYEDQDFLDTDSMPLPPLDDEDDEDDPQFLLASDGRTTADSLATEPDRPVNPMGKHIELLIDDASHSLQNLSLSPKAQVDAHQNWFLLGDGPDINGNLHRNIPGEEPPDRGTMRMATSLPSTATSSTVTSSGGHEDAAAGEGGSSRQRQFAGDMPCIREGSYFGLGKHRDGSDLAIVYQIRQVLLDDGRCVFCLWVSRDTEEAGEGGRPSCSLASSIPPPDASPHSSASRCHRHESECSSEDENLQSRRRHEDVAHESGAYADKYTTLQQIGKGAFGCVKMAYRNADRLLVVTKFIRKAKVYEDCWVVDPRFGRRVPLEVSLLATLKHPNIVEVYDVFENEDYFQMVMEKHGAGMDLFEFIDRNPNLDEPLASYIFRQVVSAISYLHGLNILHRDVKDENIIVDERFHVKLIDFGSATFMAPGRQFSTFCGTMEYCSPEVLQGNKYAGPELEMWALGVTLYTLVFGENPFFDVDETISGILRPPFKVSQELMHLIAWLLHPDPQQRCTLPQVETHSWVTQTVCPDSYRFEDVVHATYEETNPPKYYHSSSFSEEATRTTECLQPGGATSKLSDEEEEPRVHL